jgi:hypothetical protein
MKSMQVQPRRFTPTALLLCGGLLVWAADFLLIYTVSAVACAKGYAHLQIAGLPLVSFTCLTITALACIASGVLIRIALVRIREGRGANASAAFIRFMTLSVAGLGLLATLFNVIPAILLWSVSCGR